MMKNIQALAGHLTYDEINSSESEELKDSSKIKALLRPSEDKKLLAIRRGFIPSFVYVLLQRVRGKLKSGEDGQQITKQSAAADQSATNKDLSKTVREGGASKAQRPNSLDVCYLVVYI